MPDDNGPLIQLLVIAAIIAVVTWLVSVSNRKRKFENDIRAYMSRKSESENPEPRSLNSVDRDRRQPP